MIPILNDDEAMQDQCIIQIMKAVDFVNSTAPGSDAAAAWNEAKELLEGQLSEPCDMTKAAPMCCVCWALKAKKGPTLLTCSRCKASDYCSSECQLE